MNSDNHQKIVGYFIEEAKEHLETMEQGLLDLQSVMADNERVNEMFRAAHSVKGGAAMLGFTSIQKISHHLEDCFKILKENPIKVDKKLEDLFLKGNDILKELLERLQGPFGLRDDEADKIVQDSEPIFKQLETYLNQLLTGDVPAPAPKEKPAPNFTVQATGILRQMLQVFKEKETPQNRKQLLEYCVNLIKLGNGIATWEGLIKTVHKAIGNPKNSYQVLAHVVIKELKQASELLSAGNSGAIAISKNLAQLASPPQAAAPVQPAAPSSPPASTPKEIKIVAEPLAAAKALVQVFNKRELAQLIQLLQKATAPR